MSSYYPAGVLDKMREESDLAIDRLSTWMAKVRVNDERASGNSSADANFAAYKAGYARGLEKID